MRNICVRSIIGFALVLMTSSVYAETITISFPAYMKCYVVKFTANGQEQTLNPGASLNCIQGPIGTVSLRWTGTGGWCSGPEHEECAGQIDLAGGAYSKVCSSQYYSFYSYVNEDQSCGALTKKVGFDFISGGTGR